MNSESNGISPGALVGGGHYSLHVPLGESGLLWLAQDEELQRLAVVRFFPPEIREDARALETLKKRAVLAGNVTHENVCRVLEWYESAAVETFLATEYVEGKPVTEVMNGGAGRPVPWDWLKPVAASVACGLEALHRAGVVHHGVRPENVLIAADKRVKLLNAVTTGALKNPLFSPSALNEPRELRCFSPQQLAGQEPAPADDFYSLGATLFELLTGTAAFAGANLLQDICSTPAPSLRERLSAAQAQPVPDAIVDFITACLSKEPAQRPQALDCLLPRRTESIPVAAAPVETVKLQKPAENVVPLRMQGATEVLPQLHSHSELELIKAARDARPRRSPWAMAAVLFLLLSLAGVFGFFQLQKQEKEKQRMAAAAAEETRQRELAEQNARQAEEKLKQETVARKKSDDEARKAKEAARLAEERRRTESEAQARRERELAAAQKKALEPVVKPFVPPPAPSTNGEFVAMFNGRDLTDWSGDTNYWSVRDGFITAQATAQEPKERFLLTWQKGEVSNFEMHFSYRFRVLRGNRQPNGGVNYRMTGTTNLTAYQFDIVTNPRDNGSVQDDRKRNRMAGYGDSAEGTSTNKYPVLATLGDTNKLNAIKPEDWNKCVIIAQGNRLTHYINGVLAADLTDLSKSKQHTNGAIALELYTRNTNNASTFLQFSDLKIKRTEPAAKGPGLASAGK